MAATTTFKSGSSEQTVTVVGSREWTKGGNARIYFDITTDGDERKGLTGLYRVVEGQPSRFDQSVIVDDATYGYSVGQFASTHAKRDAIKAGVMDLVTQIGTKA